MQSKRISPGNQITVLSPLAVTHALARDYILSTKGTAIALSHRNLYQDLFGYMIMSWGSSACPMPFQVLSHCLHGLRLFVILDTLPWKLHHTYHGTFETNYVIFGWTCPWKYSHFPHIQERSCPWNEAKPPLPAGPWGSLCPQSPSPKHVFSMNFC